MDRDVAASDDADLPAHHVRNAGMFGPRFQNPFPEWRFPTLSELWKVLCTKIDGSRMIVDRLTKGGGSKLVGNAAPTEADFLRAFPTEDVDVDGMRSGPPGGGVQVTWLGHSSCLVQLGGVSFLTDPVFAERASPVQWFGPKRVVPCPLDLDALSDDELPPLDFVVISHSHYDHLCLPTCRQLSRRYGASITFYVPLGLREWFARNVPGAVAVELDWWETVEHNGVRVVCAPAQHWSNRSPLDRDRTLWASWAVLGPGAGERFWFAGDTGYSKTLVEDLRAHLAPLDVCAIPIGAYEPFWFMEPQHVDPAHAVRIHAELGARASFGIHCCTFNLAMEPLDEPPMRLEKEVVSQGLDPGAFVVLTQGRLDRRWARASAAQRSNPSAVESSAVNVAAD
ncbi:unnamed protein product [Pedinophyceae sp. YPF-701]|nr:unnamed protein product [Pedinophyceae sp. YPF-701]